MYCSKCGSLINDKLNYCKSCGARIGKNDSDKGAPESILDNLLTALCFIAIFGFGILVGLVAVLLSSNLPHQVVLFVALGYLAALFGVCYMILSQVPKLIDAKLKSEKSEKSEKAEASLFVPPVQISAPTTAQLEQYRGEPASVTEHTTRNFEKILRAES